MEKVRDEIAAEKLRAGQRHAEAARLEQVLAGG